MEGSFRFERRDWWTAALVFAVALAMRVPFRGIYAFQWDCGQYAIAIQHYDLRISQPQLPGYYLYVAVGRLINFFLNEPHASLVWLSVVAGAVYAGLGYLLGTALFSRGCGRAAGALLATNPFCWLQSEIALTNMVDGMLVAALMLVCWLSLQNRTRWLYLMLVAALFAAIAGNRQQSGPLVLPACAYVYYRSSSPRWLKTLVGLVVAGVLCLLWFLPMSASSGGLAVYLKCLEAKRGLDVYWVGYKGGEGLHNSIGVISFSCWAGLWLAGLLLGVELVHWLWYEPRTNKWQFLRDHREQLVLAGLWGGPFLAFGLLMYTSMSGQVLPYFPLLALAAGVAIHRLARRLKAPLAELLFIGLVVLVNVTFFLAPPRWVNGLLQDLSASAGVLRENDQKFADWTQLIRAKFKPGEVVICHKGEWFRWSFRQFQYQLPEYRNILFIHDPSLIGPPAHMFWVGQGTTTTFIEHFEAGSARSVLLFVPPDKNLKMYAELFDLRAAQEVAGSGGALYELPVTAALP